MKTNIPSSVSPLPTFVRLLLAFLLGIPFGFADTFRPISVFLTKGYNAPYK